MINNAGPTVHVALPVLDEAQLLPSLLACLDRQDYRNFKVCICINHPDDWWQKPDKRKVCESNLQLLDSLRKQYPDYILIDKCTPGQGWKGKNAGVGWARKTAMDAIAANAAGEDILISLDADTVFGSSYFSSVVRNFRENPDAVGLAVPYYHRLTGNPDADRAILHYEIYMRHYSLNLWRIRSPYTFTALGSAMACPVWAYKSVGGMTPKKSGEDFYFLQKLKKFGKMLFYTDEKVYPAARFSDRVFFGTGPAMIKGHAGDWSSYPIYPSALFDDILDTTKRFGEFYKRTEPTPVVNFLCEILKEEDPFEPLRQNFREPAKFIRACHEKLDGLRILQYLKTMQKQDITDDETSLKDFLQLYYPEDVKKIIPDPGYFSFSESPVAVLDTIRNFLAGKEEECQINSALS